MSRDSLNMPKGFLVAVAPLLLVLGACGESDDTSSSDTAASTADDVPQLTFSGSDCVYAGPEEVTAGVVTVELVNESDGTTNVNVLLLDEGTTAQDAVDALGPGPARLNLLSGVVSDMGAQSPARAGETIRWEKSLAAGQYVTICNNRNRDAWFGGGFTVVDG